MTNIQNLGWYVAEVISEIIVEGDSRNVVWTNFVLIQAESDEAAFERAMAWGREYESSYVNSDNQIVTVSHRGLHNLHPVDGDMEHGTELLYEQRIGMSNDELAAWIRPREKLNIFRKLVAPTIEPPLITRESVDRIAALFPASEASLSPVED